MPTEVKHFELEKALVSNFYNTKDITPHFIFFLPGSNVGKIFIYQTELNNKVSFSGFLSFQMPNSLQYA